MSAFSDNTHCSAETMTFIDHHSVPWSRVRRTRYWMHQRFHYTYPGPVREIRQRLVVVPADCYGDQRLCEFDLRVSAHNAATSATVDPFGNRVFHVYVPEADSEITFEAHIVVERDLAVDTQPCLSAREALVYTEPTRLTAADEVIMRAAKALAAQHRQPLELADAINTWVWEAMSYGAGSTGVKTTAAEALTIGRGLCQDYAHIMLALCRSIKLPARYVSGHMLGEGGSHAWVEVLLPDPSGNYHAVAFDPTNHRRATPAYITVASGRDYADVSPTSGSFIAPYAGLLTSSKRAGLTHVAYHDEAA